MGNKTSTNKLKCSKNDFMIKYFQNNKQNDQHVVQSGLDDRRIVFVSLFGLCSTWKTVPSVALYTALIVLPLKSKWIQNPNKFYDSLNSSFMDFMNQFVVSTETLHFIELLKWKDKQGLVIWMYDYLDAKNNPIPSRIVCDNNNNNNKHYSIATFWYHFNEKLTSLYDHISGNTYKPINLDIKWWKNKSKFVSKYNTKYSSILNEFYELKVECDPMREIIYQSNPKSLHPMIVYQTKSNIGGSLQTNKYKGKKKRTLSVKDFAISPLSPIREPPQKGIDILKVDNHDNQTRFVWPDSHTDNYNCQI
eukprot:404892_1